MDNKSLRNIYDLLNLKPYEEFTIEKSHIKYRFLPDGIRQWCNSNGGTWIADNDERSLIRIIQNPNLINKIPTNLYVYLNDDKLTMYDIIILKGLIEVYGPINHILKAYIDGEKHGCKIMFKKNVNYISFSRFWFDFFDKCPDCNEFKVIDSEDSAWGLCIEGVEGL